MLKNVHLALAYVQELGIPRHIALEGMQNSHPDPEHWKK
jgi:hypothetical protein